MVDGVDRTAAATSLYAAFPSVYAFCRERLFRDDTERIIAALWSASVPSSGSLVLELGCGPGLYARRIAERFPSIRVTGIDRCEAQLVRARRLASRRRLRNCTFLHGDVRTLAIETASVDAVVASRLFTVLCEPERALAEVHRVLRDGGTCFLAEPRPGLRAEVPLRLLWLLARLRHRDGREHGRYLEPEHALVVSAGYFAVLTASQPWSSVRRWEDRHYRYAVLRKDERAMDERATDEPCATERAA